MTEHSSVTGSEIFQTEISSDYYLTHKPFQPKREVADYVESMGIPVPQRFGSLAEAVGSGKTFIIRSEHPQDYDGVSGLIDSYKVSPAIIAKSKERTAKIGSEINWGELLRPTVHGIDDIKSQLISQIDTVSQEEFEANILKLNLTRSVQDYFELIGTNSAEFCAQASWSYWELLGGFNRSIVADTAIEGRYHVFATRGNDHNYSVIDNNEIVLSGPQVGMFEDDQKDIQAMIEFYESIRRLPRFSLSHCPIVEAQTVEGINYFLQYHRARDFEPSAFELTREPEPDELKAIFVRGATPAEGIICNTRFWYGNDFHLYDEDASFDNHWNFMFSELMFKKRKVQFIKEDRSGFANATRDLHLSKSQLFKPPVTVVLDRYEADKKIYPPHKDVEGNELRYDLSSVRSLLHVVSDGRKAYVKPLSLSYSPESEI